uniref:F-box and FNIP repeat-containing protein n=1 Tax=viral metagenome TaxID=1070528 RepID=A0A6C0C888_9ZZZZ
MLSLCDDILKHISLFLTDREKIILTMVCLTLDPLKYKLRFCEKIFVESIKHLSYFDNFENVELPCAGYFCPKYAKHVHLIAHTTDISNNITHLKFSYCFNKSIENVIPSSVTHLKFGHYFNQPIQNNVPTSVTHLSFGFHFDQPIENAIPNSVTHLSFGFCFNQKIEGNIPSSVTHLTLDYHFDQPINKLPKTVTQIILDQKYMTPISEIVLPRIVWT